VGDGQVMKYSAGNVLLQWLPLLLLKLPFTSSSSPRKMWCTTASVVRG
jgi:hypothetical protein